MVSSCRSTALLMPTKLSKQMCSLEKIVLCVNFWMAFDVSICINLCSGLNIFTINAFFVKALWLIFLYSNFCFKKRAFFEAGLASTTANSTNPLKLWGLTSTCPVSPGELVGICWHTCIKYLGSYSRISWRSFTLSKAYVSLQNFIDLLLITIIL